MRERVLLALVAILGWMACAVAQASRNHLTDEHSPYLRRASGQPVDWYPWSEDAFQRATTLKRPILLDVGAVWCPWCDLMDRDTYTHPETADFINQHFVAVKVDFDASPKLVAQLQRAQALLNLPAGLPLTSFVTPMASFTSELDTFRLNTKTASLLFEKSQMKLSRDSPTSKGSTSSHFSWRSESDYETNCLAPGSVVDRKQLYAVCYR